jgi:hypothetical protein
MRSASQRSFPWPSDVALLVDAEGVVSEVVLGVDAPEGRRPTSRNSGAIASRRR